MKILTAQQIGNVDKLTINSEPIASVDLMERAACACHDWIKDHFANNLEIKVFAGPGNNGGDGMAISRMLAKSGYKVFVYLLNSPDTFSPDARINYHKLADVKGIEVFFIKGSDDFPLLGRTDIVIDSIFGSGISRPLIGISAKLVEYINLSGAIIVSIDIPSGLRTEENEYSNNDSIVQAKYTLTFQMPKIAFFFAENERYTGEWAVIDIGLSSSAIEDQQTNYYYTGREDISKFLITRKKFAHKGNFGHSLLMAGSFGKMGAAVLASKACLHSGAGLLTTLVPYKGYDIMQTSVPEGMAIVDKNPDFIMELPELEGYNAIGIGPGTGKDEKTGQLLYSLLTKTKIPVVIDADAINLIAMHPDWMGLLSPNIILTPHPGEFDRLAGPSVNGYHRHLKQIDFSKKYNTVVVLKGAYTSITSPEGRCWFNSTGNPGMATAGSGDVLTGIILSLLSQGYQPVHGAITGVWLHGLAGDIACELNGEEALTASDIINNLGKAFQKIKKL